MKNTRTVWTGWTMMAATVAAVVTYASVAAVADESVPADGTHVVASAPEQVTRPPVKIAVVRFSSAEGDMFTSCSITVAPLKDAGEQLSREIAGKLATWPEYTILDPESVWKAVEKHHLTRKGLENPDVLRKLAELTGADAVVVGEADGTTWSGNGRQGGSLYASFRMIATADAKVLWTVDGQVQDTESTGDLVAALAADTTSRLFAQLQASQGNSLLAMAVDDLDPQN
jgi:hypothetical protein